MQLRAERACLLRCVSPRRYRNRRRVPGGAPRRAAAAARLNTGTTPAACRYVIIAV